MQILAERDRALEHAEAKNKEMKGLLDTRTAELTAFQDFAPSAEQVTDVRVAEMVNELNYEMGQTASSLSDDYAEAEPSPGADVKETMRMLGKWVGHGVAVIISHAGRSVEQDIAMQIAFQACMSARAHSIINHWCFGGVAGEELLIDVSHQISEGEQGHVSRKWRSLARQYGRWTVWDRPKAERKSVADIKELLADVLIASGHATDRTAALSSIHAKVDAHIAEVVRLAFELNEVLGQKLGAYEMEALCVYSEGPYDSDEMVDGYSTSDPSHDDTRQRLVLCTTDLGLLRVINGEKDILVKPKVALNTLVVSHAP
ncbi:hypothetical protein OF83DRAFT_1084963 [Amylostereum chailletii]|nr:hypothetical protein OF83DRAFT_1084963 [Amylostereum chailletii]